MGERRSLLGWLNLALTVILAGTLLTLGLLVAVGKVEIRPVSPRDNPRGDNSPAGPRIQPVGRAEEFFELLGHTAYCFKYEGTWIDCWIELDVDGNKTRLGEYLGEQLRLLAEAAADGKLAGVEPSGHLIWVRRSEKDKEIWDVAISIMDKDGKVKSSLRTIGISPPQSSVAHGTGSSGPSGGSLSGGQEVTLATFVTFGEQGGQRTRTAQFKCKAAK